MSFLSLQSASTFGWPSKFYLLARSTSIAVTATSLACAILCQVQCRFPDDVTHCSWKTRMPKFSIASMFVSCICSYSRIGMRFHIVSCGKMAWRPPELAGDHGSARHDSASFWPYCLSQQSGLESFTLSAAAAATTSRAMPPGHRQPPPIGHFLCLLHNFDCSGFSFISLLRLMILPDVIYIYLNCGNR